MTTVSVRYIVNDVDAAISFYHDQLGFEVQMHPAPSFAMLSRGDLRLLLSSPSGEGGGGQIMPDGRRPEPGGWNRISLEVSGLATEVERLRAAGASFRNEIVHGIGGDQILVEDPPATRSSCLNPDDDLRSHRRGGSRHNACPKAWWTQTLRAPAFRACGQSSPAMTHSVRGTGSRRESNSTKRACSNCHW